MSGFSDELLADIRLQNDIVQLIGEYVRLTRRGKNHFGLCPFHTDSKPSFCVNEEKQIFYCFGCGKGGDIFRYIMLQDNISFPEAVKILARRAGLALPEDGPVPVKDKTAEMCRHACEMAKEFFRMCLQDKKRGAMAANYLHERGVSAKTAEIFHLGYAPPGWGSFVEHCRKNGAPVKDFVDAGLIREKDGEYYDYFRNRLMFPIFDLQGRVAGFGGRVFDDSVPKYLNTPETACFNKGHMLYGLHLARKAIKEQGFLVIMEGYMDVITAHQYGVNNAVASLGTSLTKEQAKLIRRFTDNVVIAYDADSAGQAATERGLEILQQSGCRVKVLTLFEGKDPDEYIRQNGLSGWNKLLKSASSLIEFKLKRVMGGEGSLFSDKAAVLQKVLPSVADVESAVEREEAVGLVAGTLGLGWETVREELRKYINERKKWPNSDKIVKNRNNIMKKHSTAVPADDFDKKIHISIMRVLLKWPHLLPVALDKLGSDFLTDPQLAEIYNALSEYAASGDFRPDMLFNVLTQAGQDVLSRILLEEGPEQNPELLLDEYILSIRKVGRRKQMDEMLGKLKEAEKAGNTMLVEQLREKLKLLIEGGN